MVDHVVTVHHRRDPGPKDHIQQAIVESRDCIVARVSFRDTHFFLVSSLHLLCRYRRDQRSAGDDIASPLISQIDPITSICLLVSTLDGYVWCV